MLTLVKPTQPNHTEPSNSIKANNQHWHKPDSIFDTISHLTSRLIRSLPTQLLAETRASLANTYTCCSCSLSRHHHRRPFYIVASLCRSYLLAGIHLQCVVCTKASSSSILSVALFEYRFLSQTDKAVKPQRKFTQIRARAVCGPQRALASHRPLQTLNLSRSTIDSN